MIKTREGIKDYLDSCIVWWRLAKQKAEKNIPNTDGTVYDPDMCAIYIDAFQSTRSSIFGEILK